MIKIKHQRRTLTKMCKNSRVADRRHPLLCRQCCGVGAVSVRCQPVSVVGAGCFLNPLRAFLVCFSPTVNFYFVHVRAIDCALFFRRFECSSAKFFALFPWEEDYAAPVSRYFHGSYQQQHGLSLFCETAFALLVRELFDAFRVFPFKKE